MTVVPFRQSDIAPFLALAAAENWVAEAWEFEFLLAEFPQGCFIACADNNEPVGFVTSLRHDRSGWIGNLLVAQEFRGKGLGEMLFRKAWDTLVNCGAETVWLTASKDGAPLYQKLGFTRIDTIIRWSGCGRGRNDTHTVAACDSSIDPVLNDIDGRGWGDCRAALVAATAGRGTVLQRESGFVVVQPCGEARYQAGPFTAPGYGMADTLLKEALNKVSPVSSVYLDAPASNRTAMRLFNRNRMRISGSNELMYAGARPDYHPELIYGLATMGSCG